MCSIIGVGERLHKILGQIDLGTLDSGERSLPFGLHVCSLISKALSQNWLDFASCNITTQPIQRSFNALWLLWSVVWELENFNVRHFTETHYYPSYCALSNGTLAWTLDLFFSIRLIFECSYGNKSISILCTVFFVLTPATLLTCNNILSPGPVKSQNLSSVVFDEVRVKPILSATEF